MELVLRKGWFRNLFSATGVFPISILLIVSILVGLIVNHFYFDGDLEQDVYEYQIDEHIIKYIQTQLETKYKNTIQSEVSKIVRDASGGVMLVANEFVLVESDNGCFSYRHGEYVSDECYSTIESAKDMLDSVIINEVYRTRNGKEWRDIKR